VPPPRSTFTPAFCDSRLAPVRCAGDPTERWGCVGPTPKKKGGFLDRSFFFCFRFVVFFLFNGWRGRGVPGFPPPAELSGCPPWERVLTNGFFLFLSILVPPPFFFAQGAPTPPLVCPKSFFFFLPTTPTGAPFTNFVFFVLWFLCHFLSGTGSVEGFLGHFL